MEEDLTRGVLLVYARVAAKAHSVLHRMEPALGAHPVNYDNPNWEPNHPTMNFVLQALVDGQWVTYQRIDDWFRRTELRWRGGVNMEETSSHNHLRRDFTHHSDLTETEIENLDTASYYHWWSQWSEMRIDPRGQRLGWRRVYNATDSMGKPIRSVVAPARNITEDTDIRVVFRDSEGNMGTHGYEQFWSHSRDHHEGLITNNPERLDRFHPTRYADRDGVWRPADAYFGWDPDEDNMALYEAGQDYFNMPTVPGRERERPAILNRPFRSVADLGYVFRDIPWKTVDFASRYSADLGLLDVFSVDETVDDRPLVAGKVNLNTRRPEVLEVLLRNSAERLDNLNPAIGTAQMSDELATQLAREIVEENIGSPYVYAGDLIPRVLHRRFGGQPDPLHDIVVKAEREAAIRTLAGLGDTRTWNFMIDVVAQSGRFTPASQGLEDFVVSGERRYWFHVAMDRITGEVLDIKKEAVTE